MALECCCDCSGHSDTTAMKSNKLVIWTFNAGIKLSAFRSVKHNVCASSTSYHDGVLTVPKVNNSAIKPLTLKVSFF